MKFYATSLLVASMVVAYCSGYSAPIAYGLDNPVPEKPIVCLGDHVIYMACGKECEDVCQDTYRAPLFCTARCKKGCFCEEGYLKDLDTGNCVLPKDCPPR